MGYLCTNFGLPRPLYSRLRPDVRDRRRQTDVRRQTASSLNAPPKGRGITIAYGLSQAIVVGLYRGIQIQNFAVRKIIVFYQARYCRRPQSVCQFVRHNRVLCQMAKDITFLLRPCTPSLKKVSPTYLL